MAELTPPATAEDVRLLDPDGRFIARLEADRDALDELARSLWETPPAERERRLAALEVLAHRLAGAAGTFGYSEIGEAALVLDDELAGTRERRAAPPRRRITEGIARLAAALVRPTGRP